MIDLGIDETIENMNSAVITAIKKIHEDGAISKEDAEMYLNEYIVIPIKLSLFGRLKEKFYKNTNSTYVIKYVRGI